VLEWVSRDAIARRTGHAQVSAVELARLGRPELAPRPEQLLGLLREFADLLE
jgi:hypothetical protein